MNAPENGIRLQKILSERGIASRREAEKLILAGSVTVNGAVVTELGTRANPAADQIAVCGTALAAKKAKEAVVALWKPRGYTTTTRPGSAAEGRGVLELLPPKWRHLRPVGRLDRDSSGLLILTNIGELSLRLTHPRFAHQKTYHALLQRPPTTTEMAEIRQGKLRIGGETLQSAPVRVLGGARIEIVLREGKNRQIRRMFRAQGNGVEKLRRVGIGQLFLVKLGIAEGGWKQLSAPEQAALLATGSAKTGGQSGSMQA